MMKTKAGSSTTQTEAEVRTRPVIGVRRAPGFRREGYGLNLRSGGGDRASFRIRKLVPAAEVGKQDVKLKEKEVKTKEVKQEANSKDTKQKEVKVKDVKQKGAKAKNVKVKVIKAEDVEAEDVKVEDVKAKNVKAKVVKAKVVKPKVVKEKVVKEKDVKEKDVKVKERNVKPNVDELKSLEVEPRVLKRKRGESSKTVAPVANGPVADEGPNKKEPRICIPRITAEEIREHQRTQPNPRIVTRSRRIQLQQ